MKKVILIAFISLSIVMGVVFVIFANQQKDPKLAIVSITVDTEAGFSFQQYFTDPLSEGATNANTRRGKGFFVNKDGLILTNAHVVYNGDKITVITSDYNYYDAEIVSIDNDRDLAFIKINPDGRMPYLKISDQEIAERTAVFAGDKQGVVSKVNQTIDIGTKSFQNIIFTDLKLSIGDSGMPILNDKNRVIAINMGLSRGLENAIAVPLKDLNIDE